MNFFNDVGYILANYWQDFLLGVGWTLLISLIATLIGLVIGLVIGIIRTIPYSRNKVLFIVQKVMGMMT
jgi:putative lysine transport system permease protein